MFSLYIQLRPLLGAGFHGRPLSRTSGRSSHQCDLETWSQHWSALVWTWCHMLPSFYRYVQKNSSQRELHGELIWNPECFWVKGQKVDAGRSADLHKIQCRGGKTSMSFDKKHFRMLFSLGRISNLFWTIWSSTFCTENIFTKRNWESKEI